MQSAFAVLCFDLCSVWVFHVFYSFSYKRARFSEENFLYIKCLLLVSETSARNISHSRQTLRMYHIYV
jgi:hypothetical protein